MKKIILVLDNIRSAHNVGSMFRTADGLGIQEIILCGISPYPVLEIDERLPHIAKNAHKMIQKTALGAEKTVPWQYVPKTQDALMQLKNKNIPILCLEQAKTALTFEDVKKRYYDSALALVVGPEVTGISDSILSLANDIVEIPMQGEKESFNVSIAAAIAMYELAKA